MPIKRCHVGILWLDILLDELVGDGSAGSEKVLSASSDDEDINIFLKKKRAINLKCPDMKPLVKVEVLSFYPEDSIIFSYQYYEVHHDPVHRHLDGYSSLSTGLSPPAHLC
jgi:hypothetical protein